MLENFDGEFREVNEDSYEDEDEYNGLCMEYFASKEKEVDCLFDMASSEPASEENFLETAIPILSEMESCRQTTTILLMLIL